MAYEESANCRSIITMPPATVIPFMPATIEEKVLRDNFIRGNDEHLKVPYHHFSNEIHVISLSCIDYADGWPRCVRKTNNDLFRLYRKCGSMSAARHVFDKMPRRKLDYWN
ncbi:hypothetical protein AAC387_Pa02g2447 [Persea americana]